MPALPAVLVALKIRPLLLAMLALPAGLAVLKVTVCPWVKVEADAPGLKVQPPIAVLAENDRPVVLERPKDAVPAGTVAGVQLAAVLKLPEPGAASQVASCASAGAATTHSAENASKTARNRRAA